MIDCPQFKFMVYTSYLKAFFKANNPIPTQPVREFVFNLTKWRLHTETYEMVHGHRLSLQRSLKPFQGNHHSLRVNTLGGPIPISFAKYNDFQVLKNLCNVSFYQIWFIMAMPTTRTLNPIPIFFLVKTILFLMYCNSHATGLICCFFDNCLCP